MKILLFSVLLILMLAMSSSAFALDTATIAAPEQANFAPATSDNTVYVSRENENQDRSKDAAIVPQPLNYGVAPVPGAALNPYLVTWGSGHEQLPTNNGALSDEIIHTYNPTTSPSFTAVTSNSYYSGGHLGRLSIPSLDLDVKIYQGTSDSDLSKGIGHFENSSIWNGNIALAAHNRGANDHFGEIHELNIGDKIILSTKNGERTYQVTDVYKVSEMDNSMLASTSENILTLITCVRDQSELRWCVQAEEVK